MYFSWLNWFFRTPRDTLKQMLDDIASGSERTVIESFYASWISGSGFETTIHVSYGNESPDPWNIHFFHEPIKAGNEWFVAGDEEIAAVAIDKSDGKVYFCDPDLPPSRDVTRILLAPSYAHFLTDVIGFAADASE